MKIAEKRIEDKKSQELQLIMGLFFYSQVNRLLFLSQKGRQAAAVGESDPGGNPSGNGGDIILEYPERLVKKITKYLTPKLFADILMSNEDLAAPRCPAGRYL